MATKSMAYDHPAYLAPVVAQGAIAAAASSDFKFACWTTMILKSVQISSTVVGTGAATDVFKVQRIKLDPTLGTSTTSLGVLTTNTAAMYSKNVAGTYTFSQGEICSIAKGTDGTSQYTVSLEMYLSPGADVTG